MVRLKVVDGNDIRFPLYYFNSSMVRLKEPLKLSTGIGTKFQFQYGAIEGMIALYRSWPLILFQFQYGAIEGSTLFQPVQAFSVDFNSSMVRLKGRLLLGDPCRASTFQFQYGAIEGRELHEHHRPASVISIPVWCD